MGHRRTLFFFILALGLVSVSGRPQDTLKTIRDLGGKDYGHNYPRHGLNLLYWFSREFIMFDNNNNMQPAKNPREGAYGFHYYGNKENLLPSVKNLDRYAYYTVGNLFDNDKSPASERLPEYVMAEFYSSKNLDSRDQNNRDRIIVRSTPSGSIDEVYITQHYNYNGGRGSEYDPENTYRISTDLLMEIRNKPLEDFLKVFPRRTRQHYALCHSERASSQQDVPSENCNHELSEGNALSPLTALIGLCYTVFRLLTASS